MILVNINPAYRVSELEFALGHSGCRRLVATPSLKGSDFAAMVREIHPNLQQLGVVGERGRRARVLPRPDRPLQDPRYVTFVDSFPMTVTGKVQQYKMRETAVEELGLAQAAAIATA